MLTNNKHYQSSFWNNYLSKIFIGIICFLIVIMTSGWSQNDQTVPASEISQGISLTFTGDEIADNVRYLIIQDSSRAELAVKSIFRDGEPVWLKNTIEGKTEGNVLHWYFDDKNQVLVIDLGESRRSLRSLEIQIIPINFRKKFLVLSIQGVQSISEWPQSTKLLTTVRITFE